MRVTAEKVKINRPANREFRRPPAPARTFDRGVTAPMPAGAPGFNFSRVNVRNCAGGPPSSFDGVPNGGGDATMVAIDGPPTPSRATPTVARQPLPAPNRVRVVQDHPFPITPAHVGFGWRTGFGGVSEIEVSNGTTDYTGSNISEHFVGGFGTTTLGGCNNATGQGAQAGSTFTVGDPVSFSMNGLNVNLPSKKNTFYDVHLKGLQTNILPAGTNFGISVCLQRYSFGGNTIFGRLGGLLPAAFLRYHGITRQNVGGQDVANVSLRKL